MQLKDRPTHSRKQSPIWAYLTLPEDENSKAAQDELEVAVEDYLTKRSLREDKNEFWVSSCRKLVTSVLHNLCDGDSSLVHNLDEPTIQSFCSKYSLSKRSVQPRRMAKGVLLDLREITNIVALNFSEYDEKTWEAYYHLAIKTARIGTTRPGGKCDPHWWSRPLWAFTWDERLFAHATFIMLDFVAQSPIKVAVVLSNSNDIDVLNTTFACEGPQNEEFPLIHLSYTTPTPQIIDDEVPEEDEKLENEKLQEESDTVRILCATLDESSKAAPSKEFEEMEETMQPPSHDMKVEESSLMLADDFDGTEDTIEISESCKSPFQDESQQATVVSFASQELETQTHSELPSVGQSSEPSESQEVQSNLHTGRPPEVPPSPNKDVPQIDSQGIDLSLLSQLPADMRSEVRMAAAIQGRNKRKVHLPSSMQRWLSTTKASTSTSTSIQSSGGLRRSSKESSDRPMAKKARGIQEFLATNK
jgi:hypothetical protein